MGHSYLGRAIRDQIQLLFNLDMLLCFRSVSVFHWTPSVHPTGTRHANMLQTGLYKPFDFQLEHTFESCPPILRHDATVVPRLPIKPCYTSGVLLLNSFRATLLLISLLQWQQIQDSWA